MPNQWSCPGEPQGRERLCEAAVPRNRGEAGSVFMASLTCTPSQLPKSGSIGVERDGGCPGATPGQGPEEAKGGPGPRQTGQQVWLPPRHFMSLEGHQGGPEAQWGPSAD